MKETTRILDASLQLGSIGREQLPYFSSLLLPDVVKAMERGGADHSHWYCTGRCCLWGVGGICGRRLLPGDLAVRGTGLQATWRSKADGQSVGGTFVRGA